APPIPPPKVDLTADSLNLFAARVQPILMNACASCHATGRGGAFQLTRVYNSGLTRRQTMEHNVAAAVAQIEPRDPPVSRLLTKAVTIHGPGMTQAPLKNRQAAAYRSLEKWVTLTLANNPQLRAQPVVTLTPTPPPLPLPPSARAEVSFGQDRAAPLPPAPTP